MVTHFFSFEQMTSNWGRLGVFSPFQMRLILRWRTKYRCGRMRWEYSWIERISRFVAWRICNRMKLHFLELCEKCGMMVWFRFVQWIKWWWQIVCDVGRKRWKMREDFTYTHECVRIKLTICLLLVVIAGKHIRNGTTMQMELSISRWVLLH